MLDVIDFSGLVPTEVQVKGPDGKDYILREASGDAVIRYRNSILKATKLGPDGKPVSVEGLADAEPELVSLCMFRAGPDGRLVVDAQGVPDPKNRTSDRLIRSWPGRVQKVLFDKVQEISPGLLTEVDSKESLEKRLKDTQERLDKLRRNGDHEKNSPDPGAAG